MLRFIAAVALFVTARAASEPTVIVHDAPTTCADEDKIVKGKMIAVHFNITIDKSSAVGYKEPVLIIDSTRFPRRKQYVTKIGVGAAIPAWDKGLIGLCNGANLTLIAPPELAYGDTGARGERHRIPPNATLNFYMQVMHVWEASPEP